MNPRAIFEEILYGVSILAFALSSLFLGINLLLAALIVFSFIIGFFFRGWVVPIAALAAFCAAVIISPPSLGMLNLLAFGFFSLLPFFFCFRASAAKSAGFAPIEPLGAAVPVLAAVALFAINYGFFFSSTESLLPQGVVAVSLLILLAIAVAVPLLAEASKRLSAAG